MDAEQGEGDAAALAWEALELPRESGGCPRSCIVRGPFCGSPVPGTFRPLFGPGCIDVLLKHNTFEWPSLLWASLRPPPLESTPPPPFPQPLAPAMQLYTRKVEELAARPEAEAEAEALREAELMLATVHCKLGDLGIEGDSYPTVLVDFAKCAELRAKHLPAGVPVPKLLE